VDVGIDVGIAVALQILRRRDAIALGIRLAELAEVAPGPAAQVAPRLGVKRM